MASRDLKSLSRIKPVPLALRHKSCSLCCQGSLQPVHFPSKCLTRWYLPPPKAQLPPQPFCSSHYNLVKTFLKFHFVHITCLLKNLLDFLDAPDPSNPNPKLISNPLPSSPSQGFCSDSAGHTLPPRKARPVLLPCPHFLVSHHKHLFWHQP